jgi:hypothetical protein
LSSGVPSTFKMLNNDLTYHLGSIKLQYSEYYRASVSQFLVLKASCDFLCLQSQLINQTGYYIQAEFEPCKTVEADPVIFELRPEVNYNPDKNFKNQKISTISGLMKYDNKSF